MCFIGYTCIEMKKSTRSYSDRQRTLKWVLLVTVPRTVLDATASVLTRLGNAAAQLVLRTQPRRAALRTASVRQDHRQYCVLVLRTHPVGSVVLKETREFAMSNIIIRPINPEDRAWIIQFIAEHWGAEIVVSCGVVYHPQDLPGFVAIQEGEKVGLVTYNIEGESCEVVTIDSIRPSSGVGTALIEAVRDIAIKSRCKRLWLITTNDNLNALRFYQRRGFVVLAVPRDALYAYE